MKLCKVHGEGFNVIYGSESWRIALHSYKKEINGIEALSNWGCHLDSDEAFVLLDGKAKLLVLNENDGKVQIHDLKRKEAVVVEEKEWHAIVIDPGTDVLIIENKNMEKTIVKPILEEHHRQILESL